MLLSSFNIYSPERISNCRNKNKAKDEKYVTTQILTHKTFSKNNKNNTFKVLTRLL